jgi:hypothetical protein
VSKVKGVAVQLGPDKRGLWDGKFEPSFDMTLSISPQADTQAVRDLLFDFAEKYSQDAFILESESQYERDVREGKKAFPLTEFDDDGLMHYPQIVYQFANPITEQQVADLSVAMQDNGIDAFSVNENGIQLSVIKFFPDESPLTEEQKYGEREQDLRSKSEATAKATADVLGRDENTRRVVRIRRSSYRGATSEGTSEQSRRFDRSDVLNAF